MQVRPGSVSTTYGRGIYEYGSLEFDATLTAGQVTSSTSSGRGALSVGYAQVSGSLEQPAALANFGFTQDGVLVTEAGIPATSPIKNARLFVDFSATTNSGVALVNPNNSSITIDLVLRNQEGTIASSGSIRLDAMNQLLCI